MIGMEEEETTAENYRRFARLEARGRSPLYEELTEGVAGDPEVIELLHTLPRRLCQPNLLLGVVQLLFGTAEDYRVFRSYVTEHWAEVSAEMLVRRTQTNEPARCATLLPILASLPQPLALLEVGASAGLCLQPDRYAYDYGTGPEPIGPADSSVVLCCAVTGPAPLPDALPDIAWRLGVDIAPIDVRDPGATRWLEALLWPGEGDRLARLRAALDLARPDPPRILRRDLTEGIADLVATAPSDATVVVFHTAVLAYVAPEPREAFVAEVQELPVTWLAQEGASVFPSLVAGVPEDELKANEGSFVLSRDGEPLAFTDPHGAFMRWRENSG